MKLMGFHRILFTMVCIVGWINVATAQLTFECNQDATVSLSNGETTIVNCLDDDFNPTFRMRTRPLTMAFGYLVTDDQGIILQVTSGNFLKLEEFGPGEFRVYSFSYRGDIIDQTGKPVEEAELGTICYGLSANFMDIINLKSDGGTVETTNQQTQVVTCPGDGVPDIIGFQSSSSSPFYDYVITDEDNNVVNVAVDDMADFENDGLGIYRVWGLSHTGDISDVAPGDNLPQLLEDNLCWGLSDNFITINRVDPMVGSILDDQGNDTNWICLKQGEQEVVNFDLETDDIIPQALILTDAENNIISATTGNILTFDQRAPANSKVWGLGYTGTLSVTPGEIITEAVLSNECFDLSDNFYSVTVRKLDGGQVSLISGEVDTIVCVNPDVSNTLTVTNNSTGNATYIYLITDENGNYLSTSNANVIDFSNIDPGLTRIYGLSFDGMFPIEVGSNISVLNNTNACASLSSNFITVDRQEPVGGTVRFSENVFDVAVCVGDGEADLLNFSVADNLGERQSYIITDENNVVQYIVTDNSFDFESTGGGVSRVWSLSYFGNLTVEAGDAITPSLPLADRCFQLSDNFLTVTKTLVDGGTIALTDGSSTAKLCIGDNLSDNLEVSHNSSASGPYAILLVDANGQIIALSNSETLTVNDVIAGDCSIYGLSYQGELLAQAGTNINTAQLASDCYDLSENQIAVDKEIINGGEVALEGGATSFAICPEDGRPNPVSVISSNATGASFSFVVTDENNTILAVSDTSVFDLEGLGIGTLRIWGLSFSGNLTAQLGDPAATTVLSDQCYDLSDNFVTINAVDPVGGTISLTGGSTSERICPQDDQSDILDFTLENNAPNLPVAYLITNQNGIVVEILDEATFDFSNLEVGDYQVYGLTYTGNITTVLGDNINVSFLADDCFAITENFLSIAVQVPTIGAISLPDGSMATNICPTSNNPLIPIFTDGNLVGQLAYLVINGENQTISAIETGGTLDVNSLEDGDYGVFGVAYNGSLLVAEGDSFNATTNISTGCFDLSDNPILIRIVTPVPGTIVDENNNEDITICAGTGETDQMVFGSINPSQVDEAIIVFGPDSLIRAVAITDTVNFAGLSSDTLFIKKVFYTGNLTAQTGDNAITSGLSDECYALSTNTVSIVNVQVDGGSISSPDATPNDELFICAQDFTPTVLTNTSNAQDQVYSYIITNESNLVLGTVEGDTQDFNATGFTRLRVWGVSTGGPIETTPLNDITLDGINNACYDLSENYLSVVVGTPEGGRIRAALGDTSLLFCPTPEDTQLELVSTSSSNVGYVYVLTDTLNQVIQLSQESLIDFGPVDPGNYRVWGLSYTGSINDIIGLELTSAEVATSCFELSENFVEVYRSSVIDGGTLNVLGNTQDTVYTCPGDGRPDLVILETSSGDLNYQFILANTENTVIIPNLGTNVLNFDGAAPNIYHVWGISYNGNLNLSFGDDLGTDILSDSCWDLSANFIRVVNQAPDAGSLTYDNGETFKSIIPSDNLNNTATVVRNTSAPETQFALVLTNNADEILNIQIGETFEFAGLDLAPGSYQLFGVSFTQQLAGEFVGQNINEVVFSAGCYDLSQNSLTVNIVEDIGGLKEADSKQPLLAVLNATVFPNPVSNEFTLQIWTNQRGNQEAKVQLIGSTGNILQQRNPSLTLGVNELMFRTGDLPAGIYLIKIIHNGHQETLKVLKQ